MVLSGILEFTQMNQAFLVKWIEALESGKYSQPEANQVLLCNISDDRSLHLNAVGVAVEVYKEMYPDRVQASDDVKIFSGNHRNYFLIPEQMPKIEGVYYPEKPSTRGLSFVALSAMLEDATLEYNALFVLDDSCKVKSELLDQLKDEPKLLAALNDFAQKAEEKPNSDYFRKMHVCALNSEYNLTFSDLAKLLRAYFNIPVHGEAITV